MQTATFDTDIHCEKCVETLTPILNDDQGINDWSIDLSSEVKTLTVNGDSISETHVDELLGQGGFKVLIDIKQAFWNDSTLWKRASFNTLNCLIGCSIGDFGMVFFLQAFYPTTPMVWQMVLAITAGLITSILLETIILKSREHFSWSFALKTAFGMSFLSMVAMELAMTGTDFMITGGKGAFDDVWYWLALVPALIVGFITPLPYNYYKLKKFNKACH
ncbi:MAG: DUF4396 domain-containing protein [Cyclobacteriaceae bacterium]